jgi:hypothetical protein
MDDLTIQVKQVAVKGLDGGALELAGNNRRLD